MKVFSSKFKQILAIILIVCLTFANNSFSLFASQTEFPTMESKDVSDYTDEAESEDSKLNNESIESDEIESRENLDASKPAGSHSDDNNSGVGEIDNSRMGELSEPGNRNIASASDLDDGTDSEESKDIDTGEEPEEDEVFGPWPEDKNEGSHSSPVQEDELDIASASEADETEGSLTLLELEYELSIASVSEADDKKGSNNSPLQEDELGIASASEADEDETSQDSYKNDDELGIASASEIDEENLNLKNKNIASLSETKKLSSPSEIEEETKIASESEIEIEIASESELKLNNKLFGADHTHKICGATAGGSCLHTLGATHDATFDYTYEAFFNGATLTEDEIKNKLENSTTYYYLDQDISFSALTQLTINNVLVLCLNGKNINNAYFSGADIIITNCTNTVSKMTDPSDEHRLFNGNTYVYGMNKNINLNSDMVIETITNGVALFYDVQITSPDNTRTINSKSAIAPTNGLNIILESISAKNLAQMYTFFNLNDKNNVTVTVKNSTFDGLKNNISTFFFRSNTHQGSTLNFYGDNLFTNCEVGFDTYEATNEIEAVITIRGSDMLVHDGTTTIEKCISRGRSILLESVNDTANIEIKDGANLILNNNQIHMQSVTTCAMYINNNFRLYGNLSITNNKIINCGTNNSVDISSFYYLHTSQAIPVGNSKIIVSGNTSDGDEKTYPKQHVYQVLAHRTAGLFSQETGTELDTNSRMTVSFVGNVSGTIMSDWSHSDANAFDTIFKADKFFDDEFLIVKDQNKAIRLMTHGHKICGYSSLEECDHRGIATHSEIFSYAAFFGGATLTDTQKVSKLRAGGSYRLDADLVLSGPTNVNLNADLYLCLNGKTLNNVVFDSSGINNHKVYITNCKKETATIRRETGAAWFITNYKDASVVAPHKNINLINSNRMKNDTTTANKLDLYGVTFSQDPKGDILLALISTVAGGSEINLSNVNISNYDINDVNYALIDVAGSAANKATLNIYESSFEKNNDKRNNHYRNNIIYASHCNTGIYDTVFKNNSCSTVFTNINSGSSKFQNVEFVNNETLADVINLTATTNDFDNVNVSNNKRAVTQNTAVIDVTNNAVLNVKAGGMKVNNNTQVIGAVDCIWLGDDGVLNVEEGATLEIKENIFTHTSISTAMPAYSMILGNEDASRTWEINILGNLYVENNKLVNAPNPMNVVFAGLYIKDGKRITTGNGVVKVQNNGVYTDADGKVKADEKVLADYHPYQVLADNVNGFLAQAAGTELSIDSRMEVAFINSPYMGIIYDSWAHSDKNAFSTIFKADRYRDDEFSVVKDENNKLRIMAHGHKICGHMSDEECDHRGIATHSEVFSYAAFFGTATMTEDEIVNKLTAGGNYRLDKEIDLSTPRSITLTSDLRLCLNGHSLKGISFAQANFKLNITNCKDVDTTIMHGTDSRNILFRNVHVSVMSPKKNINIVSNRPISIDGTANTFNIDFYNSTFTPCGNSVTYSVFVLAQSSNYNSAINISKATIKDFVVDFPGTGAGADEGNILLTRNGTLNLYNINFTNNDSYYSLIRVTTGGIMNVYGSNLVSNFSNRRYGNLIFLDTNNVKCAFYENNIIKDNIVHGDILQGSTTTRVFEIYGVLDVEGNSFNGYGGTGDYSKLPAFHFGDVNMRNATLNIKNNKDLTAGGHGLLRIVGDLNLYNSHINVEGNTLNRGSLPTQGIFNQTAGNTYLYEGSTIKIVNNNIETTGFTGTSAGLSGMYIRANQTINISTGSIVVKGNKAVGSDAALPANYVYQVYSAQTNNTTPFLVQMAGTKLDYKNTDMEVAFASPYIGVIMENWNDNAPFTCFTANTKNDEDLKVVKDENNKIRIMTHAHKICGFNSDVECDHRGIATHSEIYNYFAFFGNATMDDAQITAKLTAGGTYKLDKDLELAAATEVYLTADLFLCLNGHSLKNVYFSSSASNDHKIYITNCKNTKVKISRSDNSANFINNYSAVSVIAPYKNIDMENSTRFLYDINTTTSKFDLYGLNLSLDGINSIISVSLIRSNSPGSEINISSVKISNYEANDNFAILQGVGNNTNRVKINIYDSIFNNNKNQTTGAERSTIFTSHCDVNIYDTDFTNNSTSTIFYNQDSGTTFFKNVNIVNNNVLEQVLNLNSSTNTFENVNMTNNSWGNGLPCALIDVKLSAVLNVKGLGMKANDNTQKSTNYLCFYMNSGTLNVDKGSKLEINNNKCMAVQSAGDYPYSILPGGNGDNTLNILGDLSIQNNKFVNVSTSINQKYVGLYLKDGNVLNVGNGTITVKNNLTYTDADGRVRADEKTSNLFHPYQVLLGGTTNSFTQVAGTELSVDSRMEIAFRNSPYTGVFFKDWKHTDILKYDTIFSADKFNNDKLTVNLNLNGHLEIVDGGHLHKPCGIDKTAVCSHRGIDDHDYGIPFTAFSNGIDMTNGTAIRNKLAAGGYYFADQNIAPTANQAVTLTANLYLCLNGKSMTNISFLGTNFKVFITNCSTSEVTIYNENATMFGILSVHMLAGKGTIKAIGDGFYNVLNNSARAVNSTFYNIVSEPNNPDESSSQLFNMRNTASLGCSYVISNCVFKGHKKGASTGAYELSIICSSRVKGRVYDSVFQNCSSRNSSFVMFEESDVLFENCTFDGIHTVNAPGSTDSAGSLFRTSRISTNTPITITLENITIINGSYKRSFIEINDDTNATVNINKSFTAQGCSINTNGGNSFLKTKTINLVDAKFDIENNTSSNNSLPGLIFAEDSIKLYNSNINISNNTVKRNNTGEQSLLRLGNGDILLASNSYIVIKDNKINTDGVTGNNNTLAALQLQSGQTISIEGGTSYIDISGNVPIGANKDLAGNHMYQIYMNKTSSTTEELFKTRNNGYIDVSKSYAEFALPTGTPTGNLFDTWNATNVKNWHADVHKNHFTASTFGNERKNLVVAHYKHTLILTEKEKYIDSQKAYIDSAGDPCVATVPEALRHDADGNKFIWWFPTEIRDAYGNIINDAKNFTLNEQYRPIMELSKWTAAADDKTRTAWDFKPVYATTYTVYLDSRYTARTETNSYFYQFTAKRGDPVTLKDFFPRLDDSRFKFLNYNTDYNGNGKTFTLGLYSRGLLASDNPSINLYGFYSFGGGGGGRTGGGGSSGGGGELQKTGSGSYQYVTAIYETHSHIADLTPLTVVWQKWERTYVAYVVFQYDDRGYPISYGQLKDGFYLIRWNGADHVYGFDKAGNMLTGYVECGGHKYIMAPDDVFEGSMLKSNAFVFGGAYMIAEDGIVNENNVYVANQFVYDMEIGRYKYIDYIADSKTPVFVKNELRNITHKGLSAKYLFSRDGYMLTGLTGYQNKIYYFNEFGPYIGSAYVGTVYAGGGHATFNSEGELVYNGTKEDMTRSGIPVQSASLTQGW